MQTFLFVMPKNNYESYDYKDPISALNDFREL